MYIFTEKIVESVGTMCISILMQQILISQQVQMQMFDVLVLVYKPEDDH